IQQCRTYRNLNRRGAEGRPLGMPGFCFRILRMLKSCLCLILLLLPFSSLAQSKGEPSKKDAKAQERANAATAKQVREDFLHAWNGYKKYAWGHDELKPL